jgi:hypothetical protein
MLGQPHGPLDKDIDTEVSEGYDFGGKVLRLKKAPIRAEASRKGVDSEARDHATRARIQGVRGRRFVVHASKEARCAFLLVYMDDWLLWAPSKT